MKSPQRTCREPQSQPEADATDQRESRVSLLVGLPAQNQRHLSPLQSPWEEVVASIGRWGSFPLERAEPRKRIIGVLLEQYGPGTWNKTQISSSAIYFYAR